MSISGIIYGSIAGMVCITPGAGYVNVLSSLVYGALAGGFCFMCVLMMRKCVDDSFDTWAVHGMGGVLGIILNGFFANDDIIGLNGM